MISVAYSPCGKWIASGGGYGDRTVRIWDAATGAAVGSPLTGHSEGVNCVVFSPNGKVIASCSGGGLNRDDSVRLWDAATGAAIGSPLTVDAGAFGVLSVCFSPKHNVIAAGCYNGKSYLVDAVAGEVKSSLRGHRYVPSLRKERLL